MNTGKPLKQVAKGGALFFSGTVVATCLQFLFGILVIRLVSQAEFGLISFAYMITNFLVTLSIFGFNSGVPCLLSKYRVCDDESMVNSLTGTAFITALFIGTCFMLAVYFSAALIGQIFNKPSVVPILRPFAFMIPPLALISILTSIFRGIGDAKPRLWFQDMALNVFRILFLFLAILLGCGLHGVVNVYVASVWIAFVLYLFYARRKLLPQIQPRLRLGTCRYLLLFSVPLLGSEVVLHIVNWAGTAILAYLRSPEDVALFNAPLRLASVIPIPLAAIVFMYLPVASQMIEGGGREEELTDLYRSVTKWAILCTLPAVLYILFEAEFIIESLFGKQYLPAANVLRILAVGLSFHTFLGPNGMTLIAHGDTRIVFMGAVLTSVVAVALSLSLVPFYGAFGAAVGSSVAKMLSNVFLSCALYIRHRIHPFTHQYVRPLAFVSLTGLTGYLLLLLYPDLKSNASLHLIIPVIISISVVTAPFITRSITRADIELLTAIESRFSRKTRIADFASAYQRR